MLAHYSFSQKIIFALIGGIVLLSIKGFNDPVLKRNLIMSPYLIRSNKQYYRLLTSGFIHADYLHLIFNMYVLYAFSIPLITFFESSYFYNQFGLLYFFLLFFLGIIAAIIPSYFKHQHNHAYASLGASGGVSSIVFAYIIILPTAEMGLLFIPLRLPATLFGGLYLVFSYYRAKNQLDNINHDAHFWGGIFGIVFMLVTALDSIKLFWSQLF